MSEWKEKRVERNKSMLERIFNSDFAKQWIKDRDVKSEIEFHGRELTEQEWKSDLLSEFFEQDLKDIVAVLPDVWEDIKEHAKDELESTVLESPEQLEEHTGSHFGSQHINVPFSLEEYVTHLDNELTNTMKQELDKTKKVE